jgi:hypothetical protein
VSNNIFTDREGLYPNDVEWAFIMDQLARPFDVDKVKFRQQSGGNFAAYADARTYYERFDEVVGANWETQSEPVGVTNTVVRDLTPLDAPKTGPNGKFHDRDKTLEFRDHTFGGVRCSIKIFGKERADVGNPANTEELKSSFSDAFKRAAVQWGVGRYFYSLGFFRSPNPTLPDEAIPEESIDFSELIKKEKEKILLSNPNPEVREAMDIILSRYSPLVSLLQKRRIFFNLKEVSAYIERSSN